MILLWPTIKTQLEPPTDPGMDVVEEDTHDLYVCFVAQKAECEQQGCGHWGLGHGRRREVRKHDEIVL